MKRRFSSYLLSGKAATLPLLPTTSFAVSDEIFSGDLHLVEYSAAGQVRVVSDFGEAPSSGSYGTTAAEVIYPGGGCTTSDPTTINVVVSGLSHGERVHLIASRDKDFLPFQSRFDGIRIGQDYNILRRFTYKAIDAEDGTGIVSIPVSLSAMGLTSGGTVYLQAAAARFDDTLGLQSVRWSELDQVDAVTESCYSSTGGSGGVYGDTGGSTGGSIYGDTGGSTGGDSLYY